MFGRCAEIVGAKCMSVIVELAVLVDRLVDEPKHTLLHELFRIVEVRDLSSALDALPFV